MYVVPEALRGLQADYLAAWAPEPRPSIIDWSEKNIFLSERNSPVAGRLRLWPYQKGMLLAMVDLELPIISVMKSSRIGFTKTMMCILGHYAHRNPCSVALLEPTLDDTRKISIFEINPLFEESPVLRGLVHRSSPGPRKASEPDNSALTTMLFPGAGSLRILSAGSPRMLRGSDIKVLLADEIDAYEISREGDALAIATQRTLSHSDRKIIVGSSPTFEGASVIERRYAESDQRIYECPCPKCGVYFELLWAHVHWPQGSPQEAFVVCL